MNINKKINPSTEEENSLVGGFFYLEMNHYIALGALYTSEPEYTA